MGTCNSCDAEAELDSECCDDGEVVEDEEPFEEHTDRMTRLAEDDDDAERDAERVRAAEW